ncbi:MAG TPA: trehalase [Elusimicrobia bacterium]|nr:trehalase [Elusimicrobiota bacterium]HBT62396.1 trehalase [Elusimicrobiota bacterium]
MKDIHEISGLFEDAQLAAALGDGKTLVDCVLKRPAEEIEKDYLLLKKSPGFALQRFIAENFELPPSYARHYESDPALPVEENIRRLWDVLTRAPVPEKSSLLGLPFSYVVPGGRFREIYYWDSYFTMLGLKEHGRVDLIENMLANFAFLIKNHGHIPNGNRSYYLSRSQPPFFALMTELLAELQGETRVYPKYRSDLCTEHSFWTQGAGGIRPGEAHRRVVRLPDGEVLNRYYDDSASPRPESYAQDVRLSAATQRTAAQLYRDLRAGAESGWDFSSRWFEKESGLGSIRTTSLIPVDLNCLLYTLEKTIAKAEGSLGNTAAAASFGALAADRKAAILKYCWNGAAGFFCDYDLVGQKPSGVISAAGLYPLFAGIADQDQASAAAAATRNRLLKRGGIAATDERTGQQWDAPNGWAPLQWIAVTGFEKYGLSDLSEDIARRWLSLNDRVFRETGKLMEKYDVEDVDRPAGGGEYESQDGFGWTNGVYMAMKRLYGL